MGGTACSIRCGQYKKKKEICCSQAIVPSRHLWDMVTEAGSQLCVNSHPYWAYYHLSFHCVLGACAVLQTQIPLLQSWQFKFSITLLRVVARKGYGKTVPRNKTDKHLFTLYYHLYLKVIHMENTLPNILLSLSRTSLSVSHKSVQCLSASVNNKWRTIIEYLAKSLSVSPGRTLMWAEGLQKVTNSE